MLNTGDKFGKLTVLTKAPPNKWGRSRYFCECDCGNLIDLDMQSLKSGNSKSCGKCSEFTTIGKRFGRLTVLRYHSNNTSNKKQFECICDCGEIIIATLNNLRSGNTASCGCYNIERIKERSITHGLTHSPEYQVWQGIKKRCYNPKDREYLNYGGRGITMCDSWKDSFINFYTDIGKRPSDDQFLVDCGYSGLYSIDRIDNDLGYFKENCKWSNYLEQANNKTNNIFENYNDLKYTIWAIIISKFSNNDILNLYPNIKSQNIQKIRLNCKEPSYVLSHIGKELHLYETITFNILLDAILAKK